MAVMFLGSPLLTSQTSASGCGVASEVDAAEAPGLPVASELSLRARPAPLGIAELSSLRIALGIASMDAGGWIEGRGGDGWTELHVGARLRWSVDSGVAVGIAPRLTSLWFRQFPSQHRVVWDVHAMVTAGSLIIGIALRELPIATLTSRPSLHVSGALRFTDADVAIDIGMNAATELWVGCTADLRATEYLRIIGAVRTQPASARVAARATLDEHQSLVCSVAVRRDLGIVPELTWTWSFAE